MRTETPTPERMAPERRALLAELMARLPDDPAAQVGLHQEFGDELRRTLRFLARQLGLPAIDDDDLDGLAFDACEVLATVARWWTPDGGALPWNYGRDRLRTMLRTWEGLRTVPLPEGDVLGAAAALCAVHDDGPAIEVLDRLVRDDAHPVLGCFQRALHRAVSLGDHELVLRYAEQLAADDPSPSHTVSALVERSPDAVRQAFCRARRKLRRLALDEADFRPLLALPLLAEDRPSRQEAA
jgi:hypothetical protein